MYSLRIVNYLSLTLGLTTCMDKEYPFVPRSRHHSLSKKQLAEYAKSTSAYLHSLKGGTKEIHLLLCCMMPLSGSICLNTNVLTKEKKARYKIQRPFQLKEFEFVHSIKVHCQPSKNKLIGIQAQCNSSQTAATKNVQALYHHP